MSYLISDMLEIANEKYLQVCELLELTKEQTKFIENEDVESLGRYIGYKQNIIDRVDLLDVRFMELKTQLESEFGIQSLESLKDNASIKKMLDLDLQTKDIVRAVIAIDQINSDKGKQLLKKLGEMMKNAYKAPVAFKEYQKEISNAIFINRQG